MKEIQIICSSFNPNIEIRFESIEDENKIYISNIIKPIFSKYLSRCLNQTLLSILKYDIISCLKNNYINDISVNIYKVDYSNGYLIPY